jgi:hypothetical protein
VVLNVVVFDRELLVLIVIVVTQRPVTSKVKFFFTCICLWRRLFRVTLEISRTVINLAYSRVPQYRDVTAGTLTATDTYALRMHM